MKKVWVSAILICVFAMQFVAQGAVAQGHHSSANNNEAVPSHSNLEGMAPPAGVIADMHTTADVSNNHVSSSGGLPQLDPSSFTSQLFWLFLVFGFLYFFFSKKSLPEISRIIENRIDRIQGDLDTAQSLKNQVSEAQKTYEESLAKSRMEAASLLKNLEIDIKSKSELELKRLQNSAVAKIDMLEKEINRARDLAMEEMNLIASEIAIEATSKIIGLRPEQSDANAIVKSLSKTAKTAKAA